MLLHWAANRWRDLPPNGEAQISLIPFPLKGSPQGGGDLMAAEEGAAIPDVQGLADEPAASGVLP